MSTKRILFIVLCALLVIMLVLTGIALSKVGDMLSPTTPTPTPTEPTVPSEVPTDPQNTEHVHSYTLTDTIKATCDGYGWNIYTCQSCQQTHMPVDERIDPLGHNYEATTVTEATCTEAGFAEYTCTRCGIKDVPADQQKDPLGHNFDHGRINEATCTEGGSTKFTCLRCGIDEVKDQTEPLGHQFDSTTTFPATCTEDAYTVSICARNGCAVEDKVIEVGTATGHTPGPWHFQGPNEFYMHCSICALSLRETAADGIAYDILLNLQQVHADPSGEGVAYISHSVTIGVPGDISAKLFTYTVNDYLCNDSLTLSYQIGVGFVMAYTDLNGAEQVYTINHCAPLTITIPFTGAPTIE